MVESGNGKIGLQAGGIHFLERIDGALICLGLGFGCQIARGQRADGARGLFFDGVAQQAEVTLEDLKEGKKARIHIHVPGEELIIDRVADTFENAITECVDAMKEKLTRSKEKKYDM